MEDNRVGYKELLVARSYKRYKKYIEGYNMCQRIKNRAETPVGKLMINEVPERM